jgi:hypothetical protein
MRWRNPANDGYCELYATATGIQQYALGDSNYDATDAGRATPGEAESRIGGN